MFKRLIIISVIFIGIVLRLFNLTGLPAGFTPDEASFGYDAYSLLLTGKDQWGKGTPLILESFGDFKPPLYAYILVPCVKFLGLTKLAVRLPNAILSSLSIIVLFFLAKEIGERLKMSGRVYDLFVISSVVLYSLSPWHIMMSRGAFEANLTTFLMPLGILLFIRGASGKRKYLIWSAFCFGLNLFSYHSAKLVTPIVVFSLFAFNVKSVNSGWKKFLPFTLIFGFFLLVTAYTFTIGAVERFNDINIFKSVAGTAGEERVKSVQSGTNPITARLLHNKVEVGLRSLAGGYLSYFSPRFFFSSGPAEATYGMMPGKGVLDWYSLPLLIGFIGYFFTRRKESLFWIVLIWVMAAPVPATLTSGPGYSANRSVIMLPGLQILLALGAVFLYEEAKKFQGIKDKIIKMCYTVYILLSFFLFAQFVDNYINILPRTRASDMLYGNLEAAIWLSENDTGKTVVFSKELSEPHIYVAFANKYNPEKYQSEIQTWGYKEAGLRWIDQLPVYKLGNYIFKKVHYDEYKNAQDVFLVGRPNDFYGNVNIVKKINYPDGTDAIYIVDTVL